MQISYEQLCKVSAAVQHINSAAPPRKDIIAIDITTQAKSYVASILHQNLVNALIIVGDTTVIKT